MMVITDYEDVPLADKHTTFQVLQVLIQVLIQESNMAQFIRTPFDGNFDGIVQVCQISYHDERVIEIFYDTDAHSPLIQNNDTYFWLTSPDIDHITINQVLIALGIANEQVVVTWIDNGQEDAILNSTVEQAPLCQMTIYPNNYPVPQNHNIGPLPMIARQPDAPIDPNAINAVEPDLFNAPDAVDNDDRSTITYYHNNSDNDSDNQQDD
jgi:hypothetical protein